jgi:hypothetical protein
VGAVSSLPPVWESRLAKVAASRAAARLEAARAEVCRVAKRRHEIEERLGPEDNPAVLAALLREYDAQGPLIDELESLVRRLADEHTAALSRLDAAAGR